MNCSYCGAQIPMGQPNCPNCGAMVQQPMGGFQPNQQPMGGFQPNQQQVGGFQPNQQQVGGFQPNQQQVGGFQPNQQPMGGFQPNQQPMGGGVNTNAIVNALKGDVTKIAGLVGALLIAINPFMTWCKYEIEFWGMKEKDSANMFGLAGGDTGEKIFILLGILLVLAGLSLMMWDLADYVPQFAALKSRVAAIPYFEFILLGVALVAIIIGLCNGAVNDVIELADEMGKGSHGAGPLFGFLGVVLAAAPRVLDKLGINIG